MVLALLHPIVAYPDEKGDEAVHAHRDGVEEGYLGIGEYALSLEMEAQYRPARESQCRDEGECHVKPKGRGELVRSLALGIMGSNFSGSGTLKKAKTRMTMRIPKGSQSQR